MTIVQQLPTTATCTGFRFCFRKFSSSSMCLKPLMLQNRAFQNFPGIGFRCSSFGSGDTYAKLSNLGSKNLQASCSFTAGHPTVLSPKSVRIFLPFRSHNNGSPAAFSFQPHFKVGLLNHVTSGNRLSYGSFDGSVGISAHYYGAFARRYFSQVPRASVNKNDKLGGLDGRRGGNKSPWSASKKHWKWKKTLACRNELEVGGGKASKFKISAHKDADIVTSRDPPVVGGKNKPKLEVSSPPLASNNQVPKGRNNQVPKGKGKKQSSAIRASSDVAAPQRVSKRVSVSKDPTPSKNGSSPAALEVSNVCNNQVPKGSNNQVPKGKGKEKQLPRSQKSQEISSATLASSDASAPQRVSKRVSVSKDPTPSKNGSSPAASEVSNVSNNQVPKGSNNQVPKGKGKKKQLPISKKSQEKSSATRVSSDAAAPQRVSKSVSVSKDPTPSKNGFSPAASENQLRTMKMNSQGKSTKEGSTPVKSDESQEVSTGSELPQKQKSSVKTWKLQKVRRQLYPPTGKSVLIVESVAKAKVIQGYLGDMFEVLPSYGHVRDLAARSGSVRPKDGFSMVWEVPSAAWTHLQIIKVALNGTENLILASDPDREGEAIAWHIVEMLQQQNALNKDINVARVVFNEITESAIKNALLAPRDIDINLVNAYLARRALDYLIGFNISPLLWRKLPGCQSAGRVQSAVLGIICNRESEIDAFKPQEYWTVQVEFLKKEMRSTTNKLSCHLTHFNSEVLEQLSITSHAEASKIEEMINISEFKVVSSSKKEIRRNPPAPYVTATLQQDAANKLQFSTTDTMRVAQKLYEGVKLSDGKSTGLITYMRTDGLYISGEAANDIRSLVVERYGKSFALETERKFFKKVKNSQEAHEAIRPTDIRRLPSMLVGTLDADSLKLYTLIWSRSIACQMKPGVLEQIQADIGNADRSIRFRSTCSRLRFPGYKAVYEDKETAAIRDDDGEGNETNEASDVLNSLVPGEPMNLGKVEVKQHHTKPPSRYSEGALVKKMEELGIGRPSTYASTIKVLRDRNYVTVKSRVLYPEFRGRMVSAFLSHHFSNVFDYSFTADMESELDKVSGGRTEWKSLLSDYWERFSHSCAHASTIHIHQVEKMLENTFEDFLFASLPDKDRTCPSCDEGTLIFKVSRYGSGYFVGCDKHPSCKYINKTICGGDDGDEALEESKFLSMEPPKLLGLKPGSSEQVLLKNGPYGPYIQLGEDRKGYMPKRASLFQVKDVSSVTLEDALQMLSYPIKLGNHPKDGQPVVLRLARGGLAIKHTRTHSPVPKNIKPSDITMDLAVEILLSKDAKHSGRPKSKKTKS